MTERIAVPTPLRIPRRCQRQDEIRRYTAEWDQQSAAAEIRQDRQRQQEIAERERQERE